MSDNQRTAEKFIYSDSCNFTATKLHRVNNDQTTHFISDNQTNYHKTSLDDHHRYDMLNYNESHSNKSIKSSTTKVLHEH